MTRLNDFWQKFIQPRRRWLMIGLGVKRWFLLLGVGSAVLGMGVVYGIIWARRIGLLPSSTLYYVLTLQWMPIWLAMILPFVLGLGLISIALMQLGQVMLAPFRDPTTAIADSLYEHQRRNRGPKIVTIGGGTGLSTLLRGLKEYTNHITAIVTVADDGGSSGRLREELGILPPGDFRSNMAALARDEALMTQLLQYRFGSDIADNKSGLKGHAFGNLLLAALAGLTGSFEEGLLSAQKVLAIRGRVLPSTLDPVVLVADVLQDGRLIQVAGESAIPKAEGKIQRVFLEPGEARVYPEVIRAILQADLIVIGPGSLYTSILPNLLVTDLAGALTSARAKKVYVCNVATQAGETDGFNVADHVAVLVNHVDQACIDIVLANNRFDVPLGSASEYVHPADLPVRRYELILTDLIHEKRPWRHDSPKLAKAIVNLLNR